RRREEATRVDARQRERADTHAARLGGGGDAACDCCREEKANEPSHARTTADGHCRLLSEVVASDRKNPSFAGVFVTSRVGMGEIPRPTGSAWRRVRRRRPRT